MLAEMVRLARPPSTSYEVRDSYEDFDDIFGLSSDSGLQNSFPFTKSSIAGTAAGAGQIEVLEWMRKEGHLTDPLFAIQAAAEGQAGSHSRHTTLISDQF